MGPSPHRLKRTDRKPRPEADRHFVTALARGLDVLACFRASDNLLSNGEIAARCGLPKSTVSRLTYTLTRLGYLLYVEEHAKYCLGAASLAVGTTMLSRLSIRQLARPMMQELADYSGAFVALGVRAQLGIIYVAVCRGQAALSLSLDVGSRLPLATTAIGRAYLATIPTAERHDLMAQLRAAEGARWSKARAGIEAALLEHQRIGCCSSFGEWQPDVAGIAVGVRTSPDLPPMVLSCGGSAAKLPRRVLLDEVRPRLRALADKLSQLR